MPKKQIKSITGDKYTDFVLANWTDVQALLNAVGHAEDFLPGWLYRQAQDAILELGDDYFRTHGMACTRDDECLWWCTEAYDMAAEAGPYFQLDSAECDRGWGVSVSGSSRSAPRISFALDLAGGKRAALPEIEKWRRALSKKRNAHVSPIPNPEYESGYVLLVECLMDDAFTVKNIKEPERFRKAVQVSVMGFTDQLLPVIESTSHRQP
jgi:hypothetical protein